jgi:hypothetical protein
MRTLEGTNFSLGGFVLGNRGAEVIGPAGTGDTLWTSAAHRADRERCSSASPVRKIDLPFGFAGFRGSFRRPGLGRRNRQRVAGGRAIAEPPSGPQWFSTKLPDASFAWVSPDTVLAVSGGTLPGSISK